MYLLATPASSDAKNNNLQNAFRLLHIRVYYLSYLSKVKYANHAYKCCILHIVELLACPSCIERYIKKKSLCFFLPSNYTQ